MIKIPVKINALEKRRRSIGLLHIVAGFFLVANVSSAYKSMGANLLWAAAVFFILAISSILYGLLRGKVDPQSRYNAVLRWVQAAAFLVLGLVWLQAGLGVKSVGVLIWAGLSAMLAFTESIALKTPQVQFEVAGISFPNGFSHKRISWEELEDVTLRPDFLTLHFLKNRYLQFELKQTLDATEVQNLQDFCRRHLGQPVAGS